MPQFDIIIIGGGPAGLTAGLYAKRAKLNTLLLERSMLGGQVAYSGPIENYPGILKTTGLRLAQKMEEQVKKVDLEVVYEEVIGLSSQQSSVKVETEQDVYTSRSVIAAVGDEAVPLGLKNEKELIGRGVSYCATCDGPLYSGKTVAVVGGGDSAVTEALYLTKIVKKVHLIHRRDKLRAEKINAERLLKMPNVHPEWNTIVTRIQGREKIESLTLEDVKTGDQGQLAVDGLFIYIGRRPFTGFLTNIEKDQWGYIKVDEDMQTSMKAVFAAGDCTSYKWRQIATAIGDGAKAAISAIQYIEREALS